MGDAALFIAGFLITIPAAAGIVGLVIAAIADGRENDRIQAQVHPEQPGNRRGSEPIAGER